MCDNIGRQDAHKFKNVIIRKKLFVNEILPIPGSTDPVIIDGLELPDDIFPTLVKYTCYEDPTSGNTYGVSVTTTDNLTFITTATNMNDASDQPDVSGGIPTGWVECIRESKLVNFVCYEEPATGNKYGVSTITYDDVNLLTVAVNMNDPSDQPDITGGIPTTWVECIKEPKLVEYTCYLDPATGNKYGVTSVTVDDATLNTIAVNMNDASDQPDVTGGIPVGWVKCTIELKTHIPSSSIVAPTQSIIEQYVTDNNIVNTYLYYTGTDTDTDIPTDVWMINENGEVFRIQGVEPVNPSFIQNLVTTPVNGTSGPTNQTIPDVLTLDIVEPGWYRIGVDMITEVVSSGASFSFSLVELQDSNGNDLWNTN